MKRFSTYYAVIPTFTGIAHEYTKLIDTLADREHGGWFLPHAGEKLE